MGRPSRKILSAGLARHRRRGPRATGGDKKEQQQNPTKCKTSTKKASGSIEIPYPQSNLSNSHLGINFSIERPASLPADPPPSESPIYLYSKLPSNDCIRLLELAPMSSYNYEPVSIRLFITKLADAPEYSAISYVWGDSFNKTPIDCQGEHLNVTRNLEDALCSLRHNDKPVVIWADAVCIDQTNLQERAWQVSLMGEIYQKAKQVFVCLDHNVEKNNFQDVQSLINDVDTLISTHASIDEMPALTEHDALFSDRRWAAFKDMLECPWFSRTWVIQEVALASYAVVIYGDAQFEYATLLRIGSWARECAVHIYSTLSFDLHITWSKTWDDHSLMRSNTFLDLLSLVRGLGCTDPRDRVYAFLGHPLAKLGEGTRTIVWPDYEKSYLDVYLEAAVNMVKQTNQIIILSATEHTEQTILEQFPSWVPRWNVNRTADSLGVNSQNYYEASGDITHLWFEIQSNSFLKVRAIPIGHVLMCTSIMDADKSTKGQEISEHLRQGAAIQSLEKEFLSEGINPFEFGFSIGKHVIALSLTLTAGMFGDQPAENEECFESHQADFEDFWKQNIGDGLECPFPALTSTASPGKAARFSYSMRLACTGRSFIYTDRECYGLAPSITKPGDICCVIRGTKVPYILRKTYGTSHYKLVGEAYIHGFMRGEAIGLVETGELREEEIIIC
jgi:hypothetical protein